MSRALVVVSGIPGSGKTTLARSLGPLLDFPVIDKDDFLDPQLHAAGPEAATRRHVLSRTADAAFQRAALDTPQAVIVSFWHVAGMRADSGTPTAWVSSHGHSVIHVWCCCAARIAAERFARRIRHPGHGDQARSFQDLVTEFDRLIALGPPALGTTLDIDTAGPVAFARLASQIRSRFLAAQPRVDADQRK